MHNETHDHKAQWAQINRHVADQVEAEDNIDGVAAKLSVDDVRFFVQALGSLDLPKEPIAWLTARLQEKANRFRNAGDEQRAREFDHRAGSLRALLHNARIASIGDERKNPDFFDPQKLDRLLAAQPVPGKAQARAEFEKILARRKG